MFLADGFWTNLFWLDLAGVAVFAASGGLVASRRQLDLMGFILVATFTGVGGGTLRDLLLGRLPVFWVDQPIYVVVTSGTALVLFLTASLVESRFRTLLWADAAGLAIASVIGTEIALQMAVAPAIAIAMGVMTATFGGLIRDVVCGELPLILRREIYATAALIGALTCAGLHVFGAEEGLRIGAGFAAAFTVRAIAIHFSLSLPTYRPRPPRDYPDR